MISSSGHQNHPIIIVHHHLISSWSNLQVMFITLPASLPRPRSGRPAYTPILWGNLSSYSWWTCFQPSFAFGMPRCTKPILYFFILFKKGNQTAIKPILKNVLIHKYSEIKRTIINQIQINEGGGGGGSKAAELVHIPSILPPISLYFVILYSFLNTSMDKKRYL